MEQDIYSYIYTKTIQELEKIIDQFDLNGRSDIGNTPLMACIRNKSVEMTELFLKYGANPNFSDSGGWYPLHFATDQGQWEIVELLVKNGAEIDRADDRDGRTPLQVAITSSINDKRKFIDYFIKLGADINKPNKYGLTPLNFAELYGVNL